MFDFSGAKIEKLMIHGVGNKLREEGVIISHSCVSISNDSVYGLLGKYFFQQFKDNGTFSFTHETDLCYNEVYQYARVAFDNESGFEDSTQGIAKHLYEMSTHPNIKKGDLCVAFIRGAVLDGDVYDAIGIFKSENKDAFLRINSYDSKYTVDWEQGINTNKLDKGCIIFNRQMEKGYSVLIVDTGVSVDAKYWTEAFLGIQRISDDFRKTKVLVDACKEFIRKDFVGEKTDKVVMLNNVVEYINSNPRLELNGFSTHVAEGSNCTEALREFITEYAEKKECLNIENFSVDQYAMKSIKRSIKNLIKLDTDIEIRIKPSSNKDKQNIEKGYDDKKQMFYYKIYFNEEE